MTAPSEIEENVKDTFLLANGLRLHYRERGAPDAPAVLLLHGLTGNAHEWDPLAGALSERFRIVAIDQRGHGASAWAGDYAVARMVEDLAEIAATLELARMAIVGHSMGALNGFLFAAQYPELVSRLVIVDFGPDSMTPQARDGWTVSLRAAAQAAYSDPEEAVAEWQTANSRAGERQLRHFIVHNLVLSADARWRWRFDAVGLESFLGQTPDEAAQWAALGRVKCPTLVVRGAHSEVLHPRTAERMARQVDGWRLVELPGGAHDLTVEQPTALTEAVERFLARSPGTGTGLLIS